MPNNFEKIRYTKNQDSRIKIMPSQYEEVRGRYSSLRSLRATAAYYGVDKRLIQFILYPERLKALQEHNKLIKHHKKYYNTEKNREYMRRFRARKREILDIPYIRTPRLKKD